jgi:hypothetical protein
MNLVEKIKQHWKVILICLLAMMWMSKCTTSCSRGKEIERQAKEIAVLDSTLTSKDSLIRELMFDISMKEGLLDAADKHTKNFTSIASDNQIILLDKLSKLTNENKKLIDENSRLKNLVNGLTKENSVLRSQLDTTLRKNN